MGLKLDKTLANGVVAPETYAKIIQVNYEQSQAYDAVEGNQIDVAFYFNKAARDSDERGYIERRTYICENKKLETRQAQYTWLKNHNDFNGASDEQD